MPQSVPKYVPHTPCRDDTAFICRFSGISCRSSAAVAQKCRLILSLLRCFAADEMNQMTGNKENRGVSKANIEGAIAFTYFDPDENARNCWQMYRCVPRAPGSIGVIVISLSGTRTRSVGGSAEAIVRLSSSQARHHLPEKLSYSLCSRNCTHGANFCSPERMSSLLV